MDPLELWMQAQLATRDNGATVYHGRVGDWFRRAGAKLARWLGGPVGRAFAAALCTAIGGAAAGVACSAGARALSRALVAGRAGLGTEPAPVPELCAPWGEWTLCKWGDGFTLHPATMGLSDALDSGYALVWAPGWSRWWAQSELAELAAE